MTRCPEQVLNGEDEAAWKMKRLVPFVERRISGVASALAEVSQAPRP
jgi:hypothetical protein